MNLVPIPFRDVRAFSLEILDMFVKKHLPEDLLDRVVCVFYVDDGITHCKALIPRD